MKNEIEKDGERPIDAVLRIFHGYMEPAIKREFPSLEFREKTDRFQFGACIGFIAGLYYGGQKEMAEKMVATFMQSFRFAKSEEHILMVWDVGCNMSFSFILYRKMKAGELHDYAEMIGKERCYECMNGGIIFHGLQETFSVSLCGGMGWSMHT